jgi:hypothetical protein
MYKTKQKEREREREIIKRKYINKYFIILIGI